MSLHALPDLTDYQLQILPGRCPGDFRFVDFHNDVYSFWKKFWTEIFTQNHAPVTTPDANIFYRQDFVAVITRRQDIVGTLFFTENNLQSDVIRQIGYFDRPHIRELTENFRAKNLTRVATYEMLTVNPRFRKKETGISFGSVLLGIVATAFRHSASDVMIGPVRLDNGVDKMAAEFGWQLVSPEYSMHGTPVAISALFKEHVQEGQNGLHQTVIKRLWGNRVDLRLAVRGEEKLAA